MMRRLIILASMTLMASAVQAAEAGKVIFVAGAAQVVERKALEGDAVQEGELLQTGADGFLYVKTADNGLFILRPNTKARIVAYQIDNANPENTRVKLELLSGVARSKSGDAVKRARQNFRFNTPVAAIGVRGTDFTVFTDDKTSRVSVLSGGIVMSGFGDACRPDGGGRDLHKGPQGQRPGEQHHRARQAGAIGGSSVDERGDRFGPDRRRQRESRRRQHRDQEREPHGGMRSLLVASLGHAALERGGHRQVDDVLNDVHDQPQGGIHAVGRQPEHPGIGGHRHQFDDVAEPGQGGEPRATRDMGSGDGFVRGRTAHSSVRTSTASPISTNSTNGAQAASTGG